MYQPNLYPDEVIAYLRKSRSDDPTMSVEEVLQKHETLIDEWCKKNLGSTVPETNKYREVVSGETLIERPEIQTVLRKIESPKFKAIVVVEPQRLSRGDLEDIGRLMKLLKYTNTQIITLQHTYDLHNEYDWDMLERELKRGNEYLEYTKKILNRGRLLSVSQGNYLGSIPPYGFDKTWVMDGKRNCPTLKENKEQADVVRMIFDLYVNKDLGLTRICQYLENLNIKPPKGKHWSRESITDMLSNVHYIGCVRWNRRKTKVIVEDSEIINTRPKSQNGEYLIYKGKHEGIVSEELFEMAANKKKNFPRVTRSKELQNPLAGLLYCRCGSAMSFKKYDNCSPRFLCTKTHCEMSSCTYQETIDSICKTLKESIANFEIQTKNNEDNSIELHNQLIENLEKKLKELDAKELAQWEAQTDPNPANRMPPAIFAQLNQRLLTEREETRQALQNAYHSMPQKINYEEKIVTFTKTLIALQDPNISAKDKNKLLKSCIERIEYVRERTSRIKGAKMHGGWINTPLQLDIRLKL